MSLPQLRPNDPIGNLAELRLAAVEIAAAIDEQIAEARARGQSWERIAHALRGQSRRALGELFPTGASATALRRMYGGRRP